LVSLALIGYFIRSLQNDAVTLDAEEDKRVKLKSVISYFVRSLQNEAVTTGGEE